MNTQFAGKEPDKQSWMRVGDADRERVVQALQGHTADGRLTLDEFATRADAAHRTRTYEELAALTADLPDRTPERRGLPRGPLAAVLVVAAVFAVLAGGGVAAEAAGLAHWDAMTAAMSAGMSGCR